MLHLQKRFAFRLCRYTVEPVIGIVKAVLSFRRFSLPGVSAAAAVDVDGVILGLAYIQSRYAHPGDELGIINLPAKPLLEKANKADLEPGDKVIVPDGATLLSRFPDAAERARLRRLAEEAALRTGL